MKAKLIVFLSFAISLCMAESLDYLVKPNGSYLVSSISYNWVNTNICPDPFYNKKDDFFFQKNNKHCHIVNVRLFYPVSSPDKLVYQNYYQDDIKQVQFDIITKQIESKNIKFAEKYIHEEEKRPSYTLVPATPANGKFPLIVFQPAFGINSNFYQNIITNLVSHGYIIAAIDSGYSQPIFSESGNILSTSSFEFSNGQTSILKPKSNIAETTSDFKFVLSNLKQLGKSNQVVQHIDFTSVGALGHSLGARSVYFNALKNTSGIAAAVALDIGRDKTLLINKKINIPFLYINAADSLSSDKKMYGKSSSFLLGVNNSLIIMTPSESNIDYSKHMSFADYPTLKYDEKLNQLYSLSYGIKYGNEQTTEYYGTANGFEFFNKLNTYLLDFFNKNLKKATKK